ncbi:Putative adipose-regulatory protein Seipin [Prunus dulcis]|uniref:Adipose-regulatory protein Seipin n=1 Tax=Prunus dulcis TaxID=3755 RepID=A0A4Y1RAN1_PRUDU|nr:Putative adipose-regulatory protein Seipin [Prunus dulcis]
MEVTEPPTSNNEEDDDVFFDALDDFASTTDQSDQFTSPSTLSFPDSTPSQATSLRGRSSRRAISGDESKTSTLESTRSSEIDSINDTRLSIRARKFKLRRNLKEPESTRDGVSSVQVPSDQNNEGSTVTTAGNDDPVGESADSAAQLGDSSFNLLVFLAGMIIKAIGLQINLFISIFTFPIWILHHSYMLVIDPFQIVRRGREYLITEVLNLWKLAGGYASPLVFQWLKDNNSVWKVALRCGWGLFWSCYVCFVLCGLLVTSLVFSGVLMRSIVAEPMHMKDMLNFDYTKHSPVAYVPVMSCAGASCGADCKEKVRLGRVSGFELYLVVIKWRSLFHSYCLNQSTTGILGSFRVQFLSVDGKTLASSSHPCMLQFKSEPIRLLLTFLKVVPLVAGYVSESQTLNLKFRGFIQGEVPTACLKLTIEQRAEYQPGAGIPQIYDASVTLESELPLFKRFIWNWKKSIFVWMSMMLFMMEMLVTLICCRPLIIPKARPRVGSVSSSATQSSLPVRN